MLDSHHFSNAPPICCLFSAFDFSYKFINWHKVSLRLRNKEISAASFRKGEVHSKQYCKNMKSPGLV